MSAVIWNNEKGVQLLLERGDKQVSTVDKYGKTPLHYAAGLGLTEIVRMLLEKGASQDAKDEDGQIPLELARVRHDSEHRCVRLLEQWGNELNIASLFEFNEK